jgi:hypothetical protein
MSTKNSRSHVTTNSNKKLTPMLYRDGGFNGFSFSGPGFIASTNTNNILFWKY